MTHKSKSWAVVLLFLAAIIFIFTPVFTGRAQINNPDNIAIPETNPLSIRGYSQNFLDQPADQTCDDSSEEGSD